MKDAILVRVRGNVILVQNLTNVVKLCLSSDACACVALETLKWFLQEIQKDLTEHRDSQRAKALVDRITAQGKSIEEQLVDGIMERLLTHPWCHKALWIPSRSCFRLKSPRAC